MSRAQDGEWEPAPLDWRGLDAHARWLWFERMWFEVGRLRDRYELPVRCGWWENAVALEALAALATWVHRYDTGEWDDPPGKLALLYDLERIGLLLRDGNEPFHPVRDQQAFVAHMIRLGCEPPDPAAESSHDPAVEPLDRADERSPPTEEE
jgi:hypothetical protein